MFHFLTVVRALGDENRLRILMALRDRELCVCQMTALLDLAPSTTSKHLTTLRQARLIEGRKHGKWVYYTLAGEAVGDATVREALAWVVHALEANARVLADEKRIAELLAADADGCAESAEHSREIHRMDHDADQGDAL